MTERSTDAGQGSLHQELGFYNENKEKFLQDHPNRFLLIKGSELIDTYASSQDAVTEGFRRYRAGPFLVRLSGTDTRTIMAPSLVRGIQCRS